jgi:hypothetical protein
MFSTDDGASWRELKLNLPTVAVTDLVVKNNDLVVATNGRSIWILDDITPLREWKPELAEEKVYLFSVQPAYRYRYNAVHEEDSRPGTHPNPPKGAVIHYQLKSKPKGEITLEVLDAQDKVVARYSSKEEPKDIPDEGDYSEREDKKPVLPTEAGLHRFVWDLSRDGAQAIRNAKLDSGNPKHGPMALPGTYTLRLTVEGKATTAKLEVLLDAREHVVAEVKAGPDGKADPHCVDPQAPLAKGELEEQQKLELKIIDDITLVSRTVEQMRTVKQQLNARIEVLHDNDKAEPLIKASREFIKKSDELEERFHNPKAKVVYDILALKGGAQLYSQLAWLLELLKQADGAPVQGIKEVYDDQAALLKKYEKEWKALLDGDLAKLNEMAKKLEFPTILVPPLERKPEQKEQK